jgi:hypothetical protein
MDHRRKKPIMLPPRAQIVAYLPGVCNRRESIPDNIYKYYNSTFEQFGGSSINEKGDEVSASSP